MSNTGQKSTEIQISTSMTITITNLEFGFGFCSYKDNKITVRNSTFYQELFARFFSSTNLCLWELSQRYLRRIRYSYSQCVGESIPYTILLTYTYYTKLPHSIYAIAFA
jgi:hypothetical protein